MHYPLLAFQFIDSTKSFILKDTAYKVACGKYFVELVGFICIFENVSCNFTCMLSNIKLVFIIFFILSDSSWVVSFLFYNQMLFKFEPK